VSRDNRLKFWDGLTGDLIATFHGYEYVEGYRGRSLAFSPDGYKFAVASAGPALALRDIRSGEVLAEFLLPARVTTSAWSGDGRSLAVGTDGGAVHLLALEGLPAGPPVVTAWRKPEPRLPLRQPVDSVKVGCPICRTWSAIQTSVLGSESACAQCGARLKVNPFTINGDCSAIAKAWRGGER
jgi:hypothetical protein